MFAPSNWQQQKAKKMPGRGGLMGAMMGRAGMPKPGFGNQLPPGGGIRLPGMGGGIGGGAMTQGGPPDDPRWTNGTWGGSRSPMQGGGSPMPPGVQNMAGGMGQGIAPSQGVSRTGIMGMKKPQMGMY